MPRGSEHTAETVGVSECSDLAVIQLDAREALPYLAWDQDKIEPAMKVYAAGFPPPAPTPS